MTGSGIQTGTDCPGFATLLLVAFALSVLSLPLSGESVAVPVPIPKPFIGPFPLKKPEVHKPGSTNATARELSSHSVELVCHRVGAKLSSVNEKECLGFEFLPAGESALGLPILLKEYVVRSPEPVKARILFIGGTHGDEYSAVSVVFKWLSFLEQDAHGFQWRVAPLLNPDGLLRKKSTRTNGNGVDLNRNPPQTGCRKASFIGSILPAAIPDVILAPPLSASLRING